MFKKISILGAALIMCLELFAGCGGTLEKQIREDYLALMHSQGETEMTLNDVKILNNYGVYNGAVVVRMNRGAYQVVTEMEIGGVYFRFVDSNTALVWKDNQFFGLSDAYGNGTLIIEDLTIIAKKVNG